jgi:CRP-like cAMP-binding protein
MISEHILLSLLKESDSRTTADIELIASFCRLFSVFADIPEHLFGSFCRIVDIQEFEPGAVIYSEGEIGSDWYVLVEGSVNICSNVHSTTPVRGVLKIGDSFGRSAIQQDVARTETVTCAAHVYLLKVTRRDYQEMMEHSGSGFDGEGQGFATAFLTALIPLPGMHIATSVARRVLPTNEVLIKQKEEPDGVYFIVSGSAAVVREVEFPAHGTGQPATRLIEIDELFTGATFGLRPLCLNEESNVSVVAKCELTTLFLNRSDFYRKVDLPKQRKSLPPDYPDDTTIRKLFRKEEQWTAFRKRVVREVLAHKKAKRLLGLQY